MQNPLEPFKSKLKTYLGYLQKPMISDHRGTCVNFLTSTCFSFTRAVQALTLSPPGTLEIGPELLLTPLSKPPLIRRSARE